MNNCLTCGKFAPEPGKAYGYVGPVCQCIVEPKIQRLGDTYSGHFPGMKVLQPMTTPSDDKPKWREFWLHKEDVSDHTEEPSNKEDCLCFVERAALTAAEVER